MWIAKMCLAVGQNVCLVCVLVAMVCPSGEAKSNYLEKSSTGLIPDNLYSKRSARLPKSKTANTSLELQQKFLEQTLSDNSKFFMHKLFQKYGANGQMTFEGFEHFLENLGLGNIQIRDHFLEDHNGESEFHELHRGDHNHHGVDESHDESQDDHSSHKHDHEKETKRKREQFSKKVKSNSDLPGTGLRKKRNANFFSSNRQKRQQDHNHDDHESHDPDHGSHGDQVNHEDHDHSSDHGHESLGHDTHGHKSSDLTTDANHDIETTTVPLATTPKLKKNRHKLSRKRPRLSSSARKKDRERGMASKSNSERQLTQSQSLSKTVRVGCAEGDSSCSQQCLSAKQLMLMFDLTPSADIREMSFLQMCPVLMYQIDSRICDSRGASHMGSQPMPSDTEDHSVHKHHDHLTNHSLSNTLTPIPSKVWGYSFISVLIISAVGLLSVAVIPIIDKVFYNHLLQFLVALAVGALSGDALLHLIPHAMELSSEDGSHGSHEDEESHGHNNNTIWIGLMALAGIYSFFMLERIVTIITEIKNKKKRLKKRSSPLFLEKESNLNLAVGAKLSGHVESCEEMVMVVHPNKAIREFATSTHTVVHECDEEHHNTGGKVEYEEVMTSLTSGHEHGHGHGHGHSHEVPNSVAAVAWMVILGDGIHNFTDGLAIGAAFASSVTGGISTSIAIFCHELPHEIGDFAVLLRAGMSIKQALVYNCLSSILCLVGMLIGVPLGNLDNASMWIFAMVGGMFIYIAFVDMLPEMTSVDTKQGEHPFCHLIVQVFGMLCGAGVMLLIAIYEHDIKISLDL